MRVLCSTFGSSGDVFPMLGLALELRSRGHQVALATNPYYEPLARKYDMPFEPLGTMAEFEACLAHPDLWHPRRSLRHIFEALQPTLRRQYEIYSELAARDDAVGVTTCFGFGALAAREQTGLPLATVHCQPSVIWSDLAPPVYGGVTGPRWLQRIVFRLGERWMIDPVVCPALNRWRAELGLPPVRKMARRWHSPDAVVGLFPKWFAPPQADWPPNVALADFPLWNDHRNEGVSPELESFLAEGDPPIAFTPGSTNLHGRTFFAAAVDACRRLGRRCVLLTEFPEQLPSPLPAGAIHVRYVPLDLLLPRCAAFVHHGGVGSSSQGLAAGIPQLVMALAHDQFDNGERLRTLGVGDWLFPRRFTGPLLARRLQRLLASADVARQAALLSKRLTARDGLAKAAAAIEACRQRANRSAPKPSASTV